MGRAHRPRHRRADPTARRAHSARWRGCTRTPRARWAPTCRVPRTRRSSPSATRRLRSARRDPQPTRPTQRRRSGGDLVSAAKPTSEEAVAKALASGDELTGAEIAAAIGLGRSTVGKALAALERAGVVRRHPGGRDGRRRLPDRWSVGQSDEPSPSASASQRLRPGQLDRLVLELHQLAGGGRGRDRVAKALGRSGWRGGQLPDPVGRRRPRAQVSDKPRRYSTSTPSTTTPGAAPTSARRGSHEGDRAGVTRRRSVSAFDACELDVLVDVVRDLRAKATRDAADAYADHAR